MEACHGTLKKMITVTKEEPVLVRPAAKTFEGLYFLSNLDQTFPYPIEIVFAYKRKGKHTENAVEILKESLAKILVKFYPFAGCLTLGWDGKMVVRCSGEGVPFVAAVSNSTIQDLGDITLIDPSKLRQLVHHADKAETILDVPLLTLQLTRFKCGGNVLGLVMNHVLVDGKAIAEFINSWAEITRGSPLSVDPFLDRSILSPRQPLRVDVLHPEYARKGRPSENSTAQYDDEPLVYKSFCFGPKKLNLLKQMAKEDGSLISPTSFQVISALMWVLWTKAFKMEPHKTTKLLTAVDGRPKFRPPMPEYYFGNGIAWSCAECQAGELVKKPFSFAVKTVHEAIKRVTEDYRKSAIDYYELLREGLESENTCWISKWSRLPFYEADFGWGEPAQVAPASLVSNLVLTLSPAKDSKEMTLSLGLPKSVMGNFQELMQEELKRK